MSNESQHPSRANRDHTASQDDAKRALISFLTGESFDLHKMTDTVHKLTQQAPDALAELHQAILRASHQAEDVDSECEDMSECLLDYVALGDQASARMPSVHRHLQSCHRCSDELTLLQDADAHRPGWVEFAQQLRAAEVLRETVTPQAESSQQLRATERPMRLILTKQGWQWRMAQSPRLVALSNADIALGRQVGGSFLRPLVRTRTILRLPSDTKESLAFTLSLPGQVAQIHYQVVPEYQAGAQQEVWYLRFELDPTSQVSMVDVGIGNADDVTTGTRTLRMDRQVEFQLPPPFQESYWLYCAWKPPQGEWQEYKTELLLGYAEGDESE